MAMYCSPFLRRSKFQGFHVPPLWSCFSPNRLNKYRLHTRVPVFLGGVAYRKNRSQELFNFRIIPIPLTQNTAPACRKVYDTVYRYRYECIRRFKISLVSFTNTEFQKCSCCNYSTVDVVPYRTGSWKHEVESNLTYAVTVLFLICYTLLQEEYMYRDIFSKHFPSPAAASTVPHVSTIEWRLSVLLVLKSANNPELL
jgi:hypothetical protein